MKKSKLLLIMFLFCTTTALASYTYQETADETFGNGSWGVGSNIFNNTIDGDWGGTSYGASSSGTTYADGYVNYTKPAGASSSSLWQVQQGYSGSKNMSNLTIPTSCWNAYAQKLVLKFGCSSDESTPDWQCSDGTDWINVSGGKGYAWEEAMYWDLVSPGGNNSPVISSLANHTTRDYYSNVSWSLDIAANASLCYGTASYDTCQHDADLSTGKDFYISDLELLTTYIYQAKSCVHAENGGNCTTDTGSFRTSDYVPRTLELDHQSLNHGNTRYDKICFIFNDGEGCIDQNGFIG